MRGTTAAGPLRLGVLGALLVSLDLAFALLQVNVEQKSVMAVEGQSITLPVWYSSSSEETPYITWFIQRAESEQVQILKYIDGVKDVDPDFKGRLDLVHAMPSKNVSITINRTLATDAGQYRCYINVKNDNSVGSSNIGVINVTILVPPARPTCSLQGDPYIGANVTLSCRSPSGQPTPQYSWIKKSSNDLRFFQPHLDPIKGTLTLTNLTSENSGTYRCTSSNTAGQATCDLTMEVTSAWRTAIIVGAVIGTIVGLCFLAALITVLLYLYRRQKKDAQDELANDIKEDAPAPKTQTWAKGNDSDLVYKNGTLSSTHSNHDHKPYPPKSPSDTTSINTAAGSNAPYRPPPYMGDKGRVTTPTPSMSSQSLPTYMAPVNGTYYTTAVPTNRGATPQANGVDKPAPRPEINVTSGMTPSNLMRMGAVPVMVPAQSQAGSLV